MILWCGLGFPNALSPISGFAYFNKAGVINWSSKKQSIITLSSTKAKYVVLTHMLKDILWIHKLLTELSSIFSFTLPITLFCDNQGAIQLSKDATFQFDKCTKHIDVHFHFICQTIISCHWCNTVPWMTWSSTSSPNYSVVSSTRNFVLSSVSSSLVLTSRGSVNILRHPHTFWHCQ